MLCTDGARVYRAFAPAVGVTHPINQRAGQRVRGSVFHVQHVNAYHARLKDWMRRFKGVSTKYLANYLGWRRVLERAPAGLPPEAWLQLAAGC
ncbi:MAG: IS1595 family transposase [Geminicoccaceae bacterium]